MPPGHLLSQRDVVLPTYEAMVSSQYPFGLAVYTAPAWPVAKTILPLMYVSPRVAADRAPAADPRNPPGVVDGWYVIARPGLPFEVRVTRVHHWPVPARLPWHDAFSVSLDVDDTPVNLTCHFREDPADLAPPLVEAAFEGYVEKQRICFGGSSVERTIRRFEFVKRDTSEVGGASSGMQASGSIKLRVRTGRRQYKGLVGDLVPELHYDICRQKKSLPEKAVAKGGISLSTARDGDVKTAISRPTPFTLSNGARLAEAEVTIFVREASWMRSRRLTDDSGSPCTHDLYKELIKKDSERKVGNARGSVTEKGGSIDLVKLEDENSSEPPGPPEVIDLDGEIDACEVTDVDNDGGAVEGNGDVIEVDNAGNEAASGNCSDVCVLETIGAAVKESASDNSSEENVRIPF